MFNKNEPKYQALLQRLQQMGDRKVLTIYVAETGESVNNNHPLRLTIQEIKDLLLPVIFLQESLEKTAPVMKNTNSLSAKINPSIYRFWPYIKGAYVSEISLNSERKIHIERIENLLESLAEDGAMPLEILLIDESKGAPLCHEIGDKIRMVFGHVVQLHFLEYNENYERNAHATQQSYASIINALYGSYGMERNFPDCLNYTIKEVGEEGHTHVRNFEV